MESVKKGIVHARLEGDLKMQHAFYPGKTDDRFVEGKLAGYMDFEQRTGRILNLRVVTDEAVYGKEPIAIAATLVR